MNLHSFLIAAAIAISAPIAAQAECLSSARAVWSAHQGSWATWRNIEGRKCWFVGERHGRSNIYPHAGPSSRDRRGDLGSAIRRRDHDIRRHDRQNDVSVTPLPRPRLGYPQISPAQGQALWNEINSTSEREKLAERLLEYARTKWRLGQ